MGEGALQRGARHLVVWDISEKNLRETVEPLRRSGSPVSGETLDERRWAVNREHDFQETTNDIRKAAAAGAPTSTVCRRLLRPWDR